MKEFFYGTREIPGGSAVRERNAVKGVYINEQNELLLIRTNKGDYKFIGGGVKDGEDHESALKREILEESGLTLRSLGECICTTTEQSADKFEENTVFKMFSCYYLCHIDLSNKSETSMDDYEIEQDFQSCLVNIDTAIENNLKLLSFGTVDINPWVKRDTDVLIYLAELVKQGSLREFFDKTCKNY